jgi:hypothetical protein
MKSTVQSLTTEGELRWRGPLGVTGFFDNLLLLR